MLTPPRPEPLARNKIGLRGFWRVADSWLDALTAKSYEMMLGHFRLPGMRVFVVNDPAWVERILVKEPHRYPKHRLMHEALEPLIGSSPFTTNGAVWKRQRHMLDQAFGAARLSLVLPLMQAACHDMVERLHDLPNGSLLDVDSVMTHVTADIVYRTIFSEPLTASEADKLFGAFARYQHVSQKAIVLKLFKLPAWWLHAARRKEAEVIRGFLADKVRQRFKSHLRDEESQGADILSGLRLAQDAEDGSVLTEREVLDQICMLFLAGHETSASALSWCVYLLGESPALQTALRAEATEKGHDLRNLEQLQAMFREVLRLYPPVGYFPREAVDDHEIRGVRVNKGDALLVFPWLLHRHRRWWELPDVFDPERFGRQHSKPYTKGTYLPFSLGERACIGAAFAMQEASLILSALLQHFSFESLPEHKPRVVGRLTVRSDKGIKVKLQHIR